MSEDIETKDETPKFEKKEEIIGIDLGTTFSCCGIWKEKIEICPNENGSRVSPSIVCIRDNETLIGESANNIMYKDYKSLMKNSKRLIGRLYDDKNVQNDIKTFNCKVIKDIETQKPKYSININNKEKYYFPEDVSSMILNHLRKFSEDFIGEKVKKAVITVPAHFNNDQREATKLAAEKAGLKVIRIINEPTAAAIAYGYENKSEEERKVLVFDLGGGTFDVSILKIKGEEFTVLASCGDDHLGGEDFTGILASFIIEKFKEDNPQFNSINFSNKGNEKEFKVYQRVWKEAEKTKKILSMQKKSCIEIDSLYKGEDFSIEILRNDFETICEKKWNYCIQYIENALKLANLSKNEIDEIILVGGSSRIPKIKKIVNKFFNDIDEDEEEEEENKNKTQEKNKKEEKNNSKEKVKILKNINADEAVAMGATIVACIETGNKSFALKNIIIKDITSQSIGIKSNNGKMINIINKGTVIPSRDKKDIFSKFFTPNVNYAKGVNVEIYEGENELADENKLIKKFSIINLPFDKKDNVIIKISLYLDHNGIFDIIAKVNEVVMKELFGIKPSFAQK